VQKVSEEISDAHESQATDTVTERIPVLGVRFDALTMPTLIERLDREVARGERFRIAFANPEFVMESRKSAFLRRYLAMTRYTLADGIGIVWAARRSGGRLPHSVPGVATVFSCWEANPVLLKRLAPGFCALIQACG
jgi:UDP-N-acetyl-D-mannosaminuronic acid transferase (WecB/TagA/CpsF family)